MFVACCHIAHLVGNENRVRGSHSSMKFKYVLMGIVFGPFQIICVFSVHSVWPSTASLCATWSARCVALLPMKGVLWSCWRCPKTSVPSSSLRKGWELTSVPRERGKSSATFWLQWERLLPRRSNLYYWTNKFVFTNLQFCLCFLYNFYHCMSGFSD